MQPRHDTHHNKISLLEGWRILEEENRARQRYWEDAIDCYLMQQQK